MNSRRIYPHSKLVAERDMPTMTFLTFITVFAICLFLIWLCWFQSTRVTNLSFELIRARQEIQEMRREIKQSPDEKPEEDYDNELRNLII